MKKTILSLSLMVAILAGFATPANAQSDLFLQGLKNPTVLNIRDLINDEGVAIDYTCDGKYDKAKVYFDDFFGGVTLSFHKKADNASDVACLSSSMTIGADGFKGDADSLFLYNDYILGYYDFNKDGHDEVVLAACSKNAGVNQMAMLVAFTYEEVNGNFAFEETLGEVTKGKMKAVLKDGLFTVSSVSPAKVVFRLKWNATSFENVYD